MGAIIVLQRTSFSVIYCQFIDLSFEKQIAQGVCENRSNTGKQNNLWLQWMALEASPGVQCQF